MWPKEFIREVLEAMPDTATFAELLDEIRLAVALEESAQDLREGNLIPHAEVKERMRRKFGCKE
jgi:hypothetical protein